MKFKEHKLLKSHEIKKPKRIDEIQRRLKGVYK